MSVLVDNLLLLLSGFDKSFTFPFKEDKKKNGALSMQPDRQLRLLPACQALTENLEDQFDSLIKDFHFAFVSVT